MSKKNKNNKSNNVNNVNSTVSNQVDANLESNLKVPQFVAMESVIGAATLLAMRSPSHKYFFNSDLEWMILPAILHKQFMLFRNNKNNPLALIVWAKVSEEVEKTMLSGAIKLRPQDWNSGDKIYIIDVITPFNATKDFLKQLQEKQFKGEEVKILRPKKDKNGFEAVLLKEFLV